MNRGIGHSIADYVVTLNNDTILVTPDWLERMVSLASLPEIGIVGACLLDQDGRREHESIVIAPYPQHLRTDSNYPHVDQFTVAVRDVAAVTGAVQMVNRGFWESLGGMDELLKVAMNDVNICLRSQLEGRYVVYIPDVQLYHHVELVARRPRSARRSQSIHQAMGHLRLLPRPLLPRGAAAPGRDHLLPAPLRRARRRRASLVA